MYARYTDKNLLIECACGCGEIRHMRDNWGRIHMYMQGHSHRGKLGHAWKTGNRILEGYKLIWDSNRRTYLRDHRMVYEIHYKCCLLPWIGIHHIDGNKLNNVIPNLRPMTRYAHSKLEAELKPDHLFKKGNIPWCKGKPLPPEVRQKIGVANKGNISPLRGSHRSEETKKKISTALIGHINWYKGKKKHN